MARKRKRRVRPGRLVYRIVKRAVCGPLLGPERMWPSWRKTKRALGMGKVASWRRDPTTGDMTMTGMHEGPDGRLKLGRASRPARQASGRAQRTAPKERAQARRRERQQRTGRGKPDGVTWMGLPLGESEQLAGEALDAAIAGFGRLPQMMRAFTPAARTAPDLTQISCDWCKGTGMRPLYVDNGSAFRTVTGVVPCTHTPFAAPGMPFRPPPGPNGLLCPPCQNTGLAGGQACPTCRGWILPWSEYDRKTPARPPRRRKRR